MDGPRCGDLAAYPSRGLPTSPSFGRIGWDIVHECAESEPHAWYGTLVSQPVLESGDCEWNKNEESGKQGGSN